MTHTAPTHAIPAIGTGTEVATTPASDTPAATAEHLAEHPFARLGLAHALVRAVQDLGYAQPTPVQTQAIPKALQPVDHAAAPHNGYTDLMVCSQTGSGKTAAFLLPLLHTLLGQHAEQEAAAQAAYQRQCDEAIARGAPPPKRPKRKNPTNARNFKPAVPGALVLCPTRELAQQVAQDAIALVRHCKGIRIANVVGGMSYQTQIARLHNANLVVATPGRLLDLQQGRQIQLDQVQFLVLDEADRMLDLGFADDLERIHQLTASRRQTMMFSATFAPRIQQLALRVMHEDGAHVQKITIATPQEKHANIQQKLFWADTPQHKRELLDHWLRDASIQQAIIFASTQLECDALAQDLQDSGFNAAALHGALSQGLRNRRLSALRDGRIQILVATDVAARGIDVPTITHVFNFGLPMKAEDYTHRIGRTGRAGREGLAITFAEPRDRRRLADIEAHTRQHFQPDTIPGLEPRRAPPPTRTREYRESRPSAWRNEPARPRNPRTGKHPPTWQHSDSADSHEHARHGGNGYRSHGYQPDTPRPHWQATQHPASARRTDTAPGRSSRHGYGHTHGHGHSNNREYPESRENHFPRQRGSRDDWARPSPAARRDPRTAPTPHSTQSATGKPYRPRAQQPQPDTPWRGKPGKKFSGTGS